MNYYNDSIERLYETMLTLRNKEEMKAFFEDICTIKEIKSMAQRLDTAFLLSEKESYQKITETAEVSSATISRVSRCLNYGSGGYAMAIERYKGTKE